MPLQPELEHVCDFEVNLTPPHEVGIPDGRARRVIPIVGGTVAGPRLAGRILGVGADWQTVEHDGLAVLDARYLVETEDGAIIEVTSQGLRHMAPEVAARAAAGEAVPFGEYYMRTAVRLASGHPDYAWVNRSLFLATGGKVGTTVRLSVFRVA